MLTVKEYLLAAGLDVEPDDIKLVKHVSHELYIPIKEMIKLGKFNQFQSEQSRAKKVFHNCKVIVSFVGMANNQAELYGVYKVNGHRDFTEKDFKKSQRILTRDIKNLKKLIWYKLKEVEEFSGLRERLIVQWKSTRGWVQKKDLDIYEILPPVKVIPFPGYQDVILTFDELKSIFSNPRAHKDWKAALEANAGIYRIVDMTSGAIYIGSAYGSEGIWGRWSNYAKNGHGGNKLLKPRDPNNFQWSIVRTVSRSMSERDVIKVEAVEKVKHGSRVHGLNDN
jgi:hypothetical protein